MAQDRYNDLVGKKFIALSVVLTVIFWAVFTRILLPFVPAETIAIQYTVASYTAFCLAGVFFLATHMFQTVLVEHKQSKGS